MPLNNSHSLDRAAIVDRARRYLATLPPAISGSGGHDATFRAACVLLHGFDLDMDEARILLGEWNTACLPLWHAADLEHKLADADATPADRPRGYLLNERERASLPPTWHAHTPATPTRRKEWPDPDLARIAAIVKDGPRAVDLTQLSPGPLDVEDAGHNCAPIMRALFTSADTADPLVCIGKSSREFATRPLSCWLSCTRLADFSLVVPAPMTARTGRTKAGKLSEHTLDNTGPRVYAPVEFDFAATNKTTGKPTIYAPLIADLLATAPEGWHERDVVRDACAALLLHLDDFTPLALAVHSGGKSLHGWFPVAGCQPGDVRRFMEYAALLGADTKHFANPSQFVRLPAGTREGGCRQSVIYNAVSINSSDAFNCGEEAK